MSIPQTNSHSPQGIKSTYALNGRESDIKYLIYHHTDSADGEVVVFIDNDLDLDWECDDKAGVMMDAMPFKTSFRKILNSIAMLEPIAHNWPDDLKLTSKRLLGESVASALRGDVDGALDAIENARKYIKTKSRQVSRYWILQSCVITGVLAGIVGFIHLTARSCIVDLIGKMPYVFSLCFWAGCVGALLFVVLRLGHQPLIDSTSERHLHYLEGIARIIGGGISGVLVGAMVKLGIILPVFGQTGMEVLAMCAAAMIAGASERLAAGIVTSVENDGTSKREGSNADN